MIEFVFKFGKGCMNVLDEVYPGNPDVYVFFTVHYYVFTHTYCLLRK